jgi:hypothetical protein
MEEKEKLPVLIDHWIEHNDSHRAEFSKWAQRAAELGLADAAKAIQAAAADLEAASASLKKALETLNTQGG